MSEKIVTTRNEEDTANVFGCRDVNVRAVEETFGVQISNRRAGSEIGDHIVISGEGDALQSGYEAISYLNRMASMNQVITEQTVHYVIDMVSGGKTSELNRLDSDCVCVTVGGKPIKARTVGQKKYIEAIRKNTVTLAVGPAGTGKTFLAVAMAVKYLRDKTVNRIILTRPAVEAGERLGFLPGDLQSKIDPYLRPLYDALYEMIGAESCAKYLERMTIEIAPLAYMRGRTLDNSFIILDEAQNTTPEQMKMFLTRLGTDSKAVVTGDPTQTDLPTGVRSGLAEAVKVLNNIDGVAIHEFSRQDVVRHKLVQDIILAYENYEKARKTGVQKKR